MSTKHVRNAADMSRFGVFLKVTCSKCHHSQTLDSMEVANAIGTKAPLYKLEPRLKCMLCGHKGGVSVSFLTPPRAR